MQTSNSFAERDAWRADLPMFTGRVTVTGTVISTKVVENQYGTTVKMLVEHETGWKVWGTIPSGLSFINETIEFWDRSVPTWSQRGLQRGDVVSFQAKVEKSGDRSFGFFSRPTKPVLLSVPDGRVDGLKDGYPHIVRSVVQAPVED